jgi:hypothetical protein
VFEEEQVRSNQGGEFCYLFNEGVPVRLDGNTGLMHTKALVVDDEWVILGSYNFTGNANRAMTRTWSLCETGRWRSKCWLNLNAFGMRRNQPKNQRCLPLAGAFHSGGKAQVVFSGLAEIGIHAAVAGGCRAAIWYITSSVMASRTSR